MDLASVKAAVKSWEKAFKAKHGRPPTKEDVKEDPGDIAEQYTLYRRLSKIPTQSQSQSRSSSGSQSQVQFKHPSSSSSIGRSQSKQSSPLQSRSTPRVVPASEYPTTPTPPSRRSSSRSIHVPEEREDFGQNLSLSAGPSRLPSPSPAHDRGRNSDDASGSASGSGSGSGSGSQRTLKRTASKAVLRSPSAAFTTPKKRPYSGPIHDPNPINPFAASPIKASPIKPSSTSAARSSAGARDELYSPYLQSTSPRKFKELLQAHSESLRKARPTATSLATTVAVASPTKAAAAAVITPRTKARKWLTGEIEATPGKSKSRRKRGEGKAAGAVTAFRKEEHLDIGGVDGEDEFGPSPMKNDGRHFASLSDGEDSSSAKTRNGDRKGKGKAGSGPGKRSEGAPYGLVRRERDSDGPVNKNKEKAGDVILTNPNRSSPVAIVPSPQVDVPDEEDGVDNGIPTPPPLPDLETAAIDSGTPSRTVGRSRVLSFSDDEAEDEWDPEGGHVKHHVRIVPTRAKPRRGWSGSEDEAVGLDRPQDDSSDEDAVSDYDDVEDEPPLPPLQHDTTTTTTSLPSPPPTASLLSILSLSSPPPKSTKYRRLEELQYKALFNPAGEDAKRLQAMKRGQEVYLPGEVEEADDLDDVALEGGEAGGEGDDDWESESDGWKRAGREMEDDVW